MHRLIPLLLALVAWLPTAPAWAEDAAPGSLLTHTIGDTTAAQPTALDPIVGVYAAAFPAGQLGLWATGHGFSLTRRASLYDLEGGASLRVHDGVRLTASYRMVGIDLGFDSDLMGADGEPGISAPFLGLAFDF